MKYSDLEIEHFNNYHNIKHMDHPHMAADYIDSIIYVNAIMKSYEIDTQLLSFFLINNSSSFNFDFIKLIVSNNRFKLSTCKYILSHSTIPEIESYKLSQKRKNILFYNIIYHIIKNTYGCLLYVTSKHHKSIIAICMVIVTALSLILKGTQ